MQYIAKLFRTLPDFKGKRRLARMIFRSQVQQSHDIKVTVPQGLIYFLPNLKETLAFDIFINGVYEPHTHKVLLSRLPQGATLLDLGANIGAVTLPILQQRPDVKCLCVEAAPWIFSYLERNMAINKLSGQTTLVNRALWMESDHELPFYSFSDKFGTGSLSPVFTDKSFPVKTITLDALIEQYLFPIPTVIKIDIEGYEYYAFQGGSSLLMRSDAPDILFEFLDWAQQNAGVEPAAEQRLLRTYGYRIYRWGTNENQWVETEEVRTGFAMLLATKKNELSHL